MCAIWYGVGAVMGVDLRRTVFELWDHDAMLVI
jgi:hypothetical protein